MKTRSKVITAFSLALIITASAFITVIRLPSPPIVNNSIQEVQLTHGSGARNDVDLSPDGKYVAYSSNQSGEFSIWLAATDGSSQTRITKMPGQELLPKWEPAGEFIAFIWKHDSFSDLCLDAFLGKGNSFCITSQRDVQHYVWSRDGEVLAFDDLKGGNIHLYYVERNVSELFPFNGTAMDPVFGTTSNDLFFSGSSGRGFFIWNSSVNGDDERRLTWGGTDIMPQVSPDGVMVMYLSNESGESQPWLVDKSGINRYLFDRPDLQPAYTFPPCPVMSSGTLPRWNANGTQILMISGTNETSKKLYVVTLNFPVDLTQQSPPPVGESIAPGTIFHLNIFDAVPLKTPVTEAMWSKDGRSMIVVTRISGSQQILFVRSGPLIHIGYGG